MPITRNGTKRPREPLLQLSIAFGHLMCRIVRRLRVGDASRRGAAVEIRTFECLSANSQERGHCLVGSLTGVVASKSVTEASKGTLRPIGNRSESVMAQGCLTERPTSRSGRKLEHSDPVVPYGRAIAQRIKGTPGITGCSLPRELGSERRETVRSLSVVGAGNLRRSDTSTRGPCWTDPWCIGCSARSTAE